MTQISSVLSIASPKILIQRSSTCLYIALATLLLAFTSLEAQTLDSEQTDPEIYNPNWQVEVIAFIHQRPDQAFRDRIDLDDYRDLPALSAILTGSQPAQPLSEHTLDRNTSGQVFTTETMREAWQKIADNYQRVAYFHWQQPAGRGSLRRLHDNLPLSADDSLSLGPHFELDGRIRITSDTIGFASMQLTHRTPLVITPGSNASEDSVANQLWRTLKLEQQRRIQPGRVEYFDSAGLSLLILITAPEQDVLQN